MNEEEIKKSAEAEKDTETTETKEKEEIVDDVEFEEVNDEGEVDAKNTIKKLREKIKKLEGEKQEYLLGWQRAQADYANLKKESDLRRVSDIKFASRKLIEDLLPTLDAYTMASSNKEAWESVDKNWRIGIEYIFNQLNSVLEKDGLTSFGKVGDKFDPSLHESVESKDTDDVVKDDTIESILTLGYKLHGNVIRPAKVKTWAKR